MSRKADPSTAAPLYKQLEESFVRDIAEGRLKPGEPVPSTYSLAAQFGISRVTAVRCYEQLKARGILLAKRGGATIVNPALVLGEVDPRRSFSFDPHQIAAFDNRKEIMAHAPQAPPHGLLPTRAWLKATQSVLEERLPDFSSRAYDIVSARLKRAIASFLIRSRGMSLYPSNILLFDSKRQAFDFVAENFLQENSKVAVENPGDPLLYEAFRRCSADLVGMPVDREGAVVDQLLPQSGISMLVVSPSGQFPTGVIFSERRRQQIARYAGSNDAMLLEDDAACLIRFGKQPEPSLFNKYKNALHIGSFGAYLGPLSQIAYLVVPEHLVETSNLQKESRNFCRPRLELSVLSCLLETGALDLAIFKMRAQLAQSRQQLFSTLHTDFKDLLTINAGCTGYDLLVRFNSRFSRERVLSEIENSDLFSRTLCRFYLDECAPSRVELLLPVVESGTPGGTSSTVEKLYALQSGLLERGQVEFSPPGHSYLSLSC